MDYMMVSLLQVVLLKIFDEIVLIIKDHEKYYPDDYKLIGMCIEQQLEEQRPEGKLQKPLLLVEIVLCATSVDIRPTR